MVGKETEQNIKGIGKIPSDWEVKQLNEIAEFITKGATPTTYGFKWENEGIPFFKSDCIKNGQFIYGNYQYISEEAHESLKRSKVKSGDILISITGDVGKVAIIPDSIEEANINQHVAKITINNNEANSSYIYHWLNQKKIRDYYNVIKTGLAFPQISLEQVRKTNVPLPDIKEQEKIVLILSAWDKAIKLKEKLIEQKKEQKKGLMERLLTGKQRVKGFEQKWELKKIKDIAEIYLGLTYTPKYVSEGIPFISVKDLDGDNIDFSNTKYISREEFESSTSNAKPVKGDILFGRVGTLGNPIVLNEEREFCIFVSLGFLRIKDESSSNYFIKYWMQSNLFKRQVESKVAGSSQKNLNTGWLKEFEVKIPNKTEQQAIVKVLSGMDKELNLLHEELRLLKKQKQALMQQLLTGKIRVKV